MFRNYLKVAFRNLIKNKVNAYINIFGLSIAIAASVIIFLFARNELTYEAFHENVESIFLVYKERYLADGMQITRDTWVPLADELKSAYPEIEDVTRIWNTNDWVQSGNKKFQETITYVDASFLNIFTFPLAQGEAESAFSDIHSVVISQAVAEKYFGDGDPIGRTITVNYDTDYVIRGVLQDVPQNSLLQPDFLIPMASLSFYEDLRDNWSQSFIFTYVLLKDGIGPSTLESEFPKFVSKTWDQELSETMKLKLLNRADLYNELTGANTYAYILLGVALIIVVIAAINFVNLSTARSVERAREIGMRKVLGAHRSQLVKQFISEAMIMSGLALIQGMCLVELFLPRFNELYQVSLEIDYFGNVLVLLSLLGLAAVIGVVAGVYPAFVLSRYRPAQSLKGRLKTKAGGLQLRNGLVVLQFALAIFLIIGTGVMWKQVRFMRHARLNFDKENVLAIPVRLGDFEDPDEAPLRLETFENELRQHSQIVSVSSSRHVPGAGYGSFVFAYPGVGDDSPRLRLRRTAIDAHFFTTYGIEFVEGKDFSEELMSEAGESVIINESALHAFGWPSGAGRRLRVNDRVYNVLGVVKDYHFQSLASGLAPLVHRYQPTGSNRHRFVSVKIAGGNIAAVMEYVREKWQQVDPTRPFDFFFIDENFDLLYRNEQRLTTVTSSFTILAILIACLGLFALSSLMVTQRTKEIGVRKTIGASIASIVVLISKDFAKLVGVAFLIASPVAYFAGHQWLSDFTNRTNIGLELFLAAGVLSVLIAFLTVSYQSTKAALTNPVEALRHE